MRPGRRPVYPALWNAMRRIVASVGVFLMLATSAFAHHSYGEFDRDHPIMVEGIVQQVILGNPHAVLQLRTDKNIVYTAELGNALQLARTGVKAGTLRAGDRIVVTGCPLRDASFHTISLVTEIRRPADGWRWSQPNAGQTGR
jgi:hypothetical protein